VSALAASLILGQLAALGPGSYAGTLTFSDRSEVRLRSAPLGETAIDLETVPVLTLGLAGRRSDWTLAYSPAVSYLDIEDERLLTLTNSARLAFGWTESRRLRFTLGVEGAIGRQVSLGLREEQSLAPPAPAPEPVTPVAEGAVLYTLTYSASAGLAYVFSPRWHGRLGATYGGGRGLDEATRALVPEYRGPSGEAALVHSATRQDELTSRVRGFYVEGPDTGGRALGLEAAEIWRHTWTPRTAGSLGAGLAWLRQRVSGEDPYVTVVAPSGEATLTHVIPLGHAETLTLYGATTLGVAYDPILAVADPVVGAVASATWARPRYGVVAAGSTTITLPADPDRSSARALAASLTGTYTPVPEVGFEAGGRLFVQDIPAPETAGGPPPSEEAVDLGSEPQWALFVAVRFDLPLARF